MPVFIRPADSFWNKISTKVNQKMVRWMVRGESIFYNIIESRWVVHQYIIVIEFVEACETNFWSSLVIISRFILQ